MAKTRRLTSANDNAPLRAKMRANASRGVDRSAFVKTAPAMKTSVRPSNWRLKELLVLGVIGALVSLFALLANFTGITLTLGTVLLAGSAIALAIFVPTRSRMALMASLFGSAALAGLCLIDSLAGIAPTLPAMGVVALVSGAHIWAAMRHKTRLGLIIATTLVLIWAGLFAANANLSLAALGSLVFLFGAAWHRLGKAARDQNRFGADWHIVLGWITAIIGAMTVQQLWMKPDISAAATPMPSLWVFGAGLAMAAIFISSLMRRKYHKINAIGLVLVSLVTAIIPLAAYRPDVIFAAFGQMPGLKATPGFGLMLGAAIMASAIGMVVSGLKRHKFGYVLLGVIVFGGQALLVLQPALMSIDFVIVTLLSFVTALAIGGTVAGSSLTADTLPALQNQRPIQPQPSPPQKPQSSPLSAIR